MTYTNPALDKLREVTARNNANGGAIYEIPTPRVRVERAIAACRADGYEPDPREIAEKLVDEDVSASLYEGCSSELEGWFCDFERIAETVLGG